LLLKKIKIFDIFYTYLSRQSSIQRGASNFFKFPERKIITVDEPCYISRLALFFSKNNKNWDAPIQRASTVLLSKQQYLRPHDKILRFRLGKG
jgi:hypothetical protein